MKRSGGSLVESVRDLPGLAAFGRPGRMNINEAIELVADKYDLSHEPKDYTFIVLKALHANEPNDNGDAFPMDELERFSEKYGCKVYETFILKPHFVEHNQSGPAYGFILDAHLEKTGESEGYVELVIAVDTKKDPIYGALAKAGRIKTFSMGCTVGSTECSICKNRAASEKEFCEHVREGKMKTFKVADESGKETDQLAFERCYDVVYDEISGVADPADKGATFEEKLGTKKVGMKRTAREVSDEIRLINKEIKKSNGLEPADGKEPEEDVLSRVYTQYIKKNNSYYPAGDVILKAKLDARPYEVEADMAGLYFTKVKPLTDELMVFSNSAMDSVVHEVDKFWSSKEAYKKLGLTHNRGILLYGPPGTGKSVCLQQVADLMARRGDVVFFVKSASIIVDALKAFRDVEPDRKVVVAFEEADEFCQYNERDMLRVMDGDAKIDGVLFLATTNYIDKLPPRMLRPGRFDRKVFVDYPSYEARLQYLSQKLSKVGVDVKKAAELAKKSEGLGFGHLRELITGIYAIGDDEDSVVAKLKQKIAKVAGKKKTAADIVIIKDEDGKEWTYVGDGIKVLEKEMESGKKEVQIDTTPTEGIEVTKEKESRRKHADDEYEDWTLDLTLGDLVDFGPYGKLYILRTGQGSKGDRLWVTDEREERFNPDASGWYIRTSYAEKLIEKGEDIDEDEMGAKGRKMSFRVRIKKADEFKTPTMTTDTTQMQQLEKGWLNYLSDDVQGRKVMDDTGAQKWFTDRYKRPPTPQETDKMRNLFSSNKEFKKEKNREATMKKREFFITAMDRKSGLVQYPGYKNWTVTFESGRRASKVALGNGKHSFGKIMTGKTDAKRFAEAVLDDLVRIGLARTVKKYGFGKFRSVLDNGTTDKDPGSISPREKAVSDDGMTDKEGYDVKNVSREITDDAVNDKAAKKKAAENLDKDTMISDIIKYHDSLDPGNPEDFNFLVLFYINLADYKGTSKNIEKGLRNMPEEELKDWHRQFKRMVPKKKAAEKKDEWTGARKALKLNKVRYLNAKKLIAAVQSLYKKHEKLEGTKAASAVEKLFTKKAEGEEEGVYVDVPGLMEEIVNFWVADEKMGPEEVSEKMVDDFVETGAPDEVVDEIREEVREIAEEIGEEGSEGSEEGAPEAEEPEGTEEGAPEAEEETPSMDEMGMEEVEVSASKKAREAIELYQAKFKKALKLAVKRQLLNMEPKGIFAVKRELCERLINPVDNAKFGGLKSEIAVDVIERSFRTAMSPKVIDEIIGSATKLMELDDKAFAQIEEDAAGLLPVNITGESEDSGKEARGSKTLVARTGVELHGDNGLDADLIRSALPSFGLK